MTRAKRNNKKGKENVGVELNLFVVFAVLIVALSFILVGNMTGLFVVGEPVQTDNVSFTFIHDDIVNYSFEFAPTSVRLSGKLTGNGTAKIYLVSGGIRYLVMDIDGAKSSLDLITGHAISNSTENSTEDSSDDSGVTTTTLGLEVTTTTLEDYANESDNSLPVWIGGLDSIALKEDTDVTLDLSQYFSDPDGDKLTFITGGADNFNVVMDGNLVTLTPYSGFSGTSEIKFLASDGELSVLSPSISIDVAPVLESKDYVYDFDKECIETCVMPKIGKDVSFEIMINDAELEIYEITFSYQKINENKPPYFYDIPVQTWYEGSDHLLNLSYHSNDPDNDVLTYSSTSTDNIDISIDGEIATLSPKQGWFGNETVQFIVSDQNYSVLSKEVILEVLPIPNNITNATISGRNEETIQVMAVINKPVRWLKKVKLNHSETNISVNITSEAENIKVRKMVGDVSIEITGDVRIRINETFMDLNNVEKDKKLEDITGFAIIDNKAGKGVLTKVFDYLSKPSVTGRAVQDIESTNLSVNTTAPGTAELFIEGNVTEVHIEYFTEAPIAIERNVSRGLKQVIVSSNIPYKNVLAYTELDTQVPSYAIKVYWLVNKSEYNRYIGINEENITDSRKSYALDITGRQGFGVKFEDFDENGLMDYVEWIAPHLSNQTFEISINVLNVQSYPMVGGNWTVAFTTIGSSNLTISAINATSYSEVYNDNVTTKDDLEILSLVCGNYTLFDRYENVSNNVEFILPDQSHVQFNDTFNHQYPIRSLFVKDYSCQYTAYYTVKAITPGIHNQMFQFGFDTVFANNFANYPPTTDIVAFADGNYTNTRYFG